MPDSNDNAAQENASNDTPPPPRNSPNGEANAQPDASSAKRNASEENAPPTAPPTAPSDTSTESASVEDADAQPAVQPAAEPAAGPATGPALPDLSHYPGWAQEMARKYLTKTLVAFTLHGDVRDLVPMASPNGSPGSPETRQYVPLRDFLTEELFAARDVVIFYDRSAGIHFADEASKRDFNRALSGYDAIFGTEYQQRLPKNPAQVFELLENYFRMRLSDGVRVACVLDYAETIVPMAEASMYSAEDRQALVYLQKWSRDPLFLEKDFTLTLLTENLTDLNQQFIQSPHTAEIHVAIPDRDAREAYLNTALRGQRDVFEAHSDVPPAALIENTAGLNITQLRTILADVMENRTRLTAERLSALKKEFIEAEAYGLLEFIETDRTLDLVAGHTEAKAHLRKAASALQNGRPDVMPMGYLVSGPVGCGKTFLISCFAGEIGIPMVKLKNFRSQWQGVTEGNLEKILNLLEAMTPVAVMIDEADAALGDRDASGDSGVSQRVFSQIVSFMSDPAHRGRVLFFLVTARPDLMPVDLKRQGRAEEHLALFYPHTRADREELLDVMMRRTGVEMTMEDVPDVLLNGERTYSGADMEAILTRAAFRAAGESSDALADADTPSGALVTPDILRATVEDFIPPTYPTEIELQTYAAVLECTSRALLPARYRDMPRPDVVERVAELKRMVD